MQRNEVHELVSVEFDKWLNLQKLNGWSAEISNGAILAVSQMVINIKEDPSSSWIDMNAEETQKYAIAAIPNILNDIFSRYPKRRRPRNLAKITSWEIWHGISDALESWCPIPKEF